MSKSQPALTIGQAAAKLGAPDWKVRRLFDAIAPNAPRLGDDRVVPAELLPKLADGLFRDGYLVKRPG